MIEMIKSLDILQNKTKKPQSSWHCLANYYNDQVLQFLFTGGHRLAISVRVTAMLNTDKYNVHKYEHFCLWQGILS